MLTTPHHQPHAPPPLPPPTHPHPHILYRRLHCMHLPCSTVHIHRTQHAGRLCRILCHRSIGQHHTTAVPLELLHSRQRQWLFMHGRWGGWGDVKVPRIVTILLLHSLQAKGFLWGVVVRGGVVIQVRHGGALHCMELEGLCWGVLPTAVPLLLLLVGGSRRWGEPRVAGGALRAPHGTNGGPCKCGSWDGGGVFLVFLAQ